VGTHGDARVHIDPEVTDDGHRRHSRVTDTNRTSRDLVVT